MFVLPILQNINKNELDIARKEYGAVSSITYCELLYTVCGEASLSSSSKLLGVHENTLYRLLNKLFTQPSNIGNKSRWDLYLLSLGGMYKCAKCSFIKTIDNFNKRQDTYQPYCKECEQIRCRKYRQDNLESCKLSNKAHYYNNKEQYVANKARRRARELHALPSWADLDAIAEFYRHRPEGYHVDHIVPLQGTLVCGLHTLDNLQYLLAKDNLSKGNRFIV